MHDTLLMIFTGVLALAVVIQTILFFGMYKAIRQISAYLDGFGKDLLRNIDRVSARADECLTAIKKVAEGLKPIQEKLADTTEIIHKRVTELDGFLAETTDMARLEILRIQDTIQSASQKAEHTLELLHKGIFAPINEISAITRAIRVAMDVLFRRRNNPSRSAQDDEMFI
jgi:hypothetical protein